MDRGGFSPAIVKDILRFNGKLFKGASADSYSLLLNTEQIDSLITAARANWREVEPAIFGTLLERALEPSERHALGAHYTPRAYVERLVLPTVIEPLRAEWSDAQVAALTLAHEAAELEANPPDVSAKTKKGLEAVYRHNSDVRAKWKEARDQVRAFLHRLCTLRVLDPACGSGNFLYVTLEHLKRLEGEVLNQLDTLGDAQESLDLGRETVTVQQLLGIEINGRAAALAELVLWIGFLQWHIRSRGRASVAEPVVHDYGNIENRDAVLAYVRQEPLTDSAGRPVTRWDGTSTKPHPVTGQPVPDEAAQVPQWRYESPRQAEWPRADFIVGNPPFIGNKRMRLVLGDGYADALRSAWPEVPESVDFVMYWWHKAAEAVRVGAAERFGLITTNSLTMFFNRRVIEAHQSTTPPLGLAFAVPDHPWVDNAEGAAVRIAMSVGVRGATEGCLQTVIDEKDVGEGELAVTLATRHGLIHADLSVGAKVLTAKRLIANTGLCFQGMNLVGKGFRLQESDVRALGYDPAALPDVIKPHGNARDLLQGGEHGWVIDFYGHTAEQARQLHPSLYQWLLDRVKPERDLNSRASRRNNWWLFGETVGKLRRAWAGLPRVIVTAETAKHRIFVFQALPFCPDHKLYAICDADPLVLGVLSSAPHATWSLAAGGTLEDRPTWTNTTTFLPFPFPAEDTGLTPKLAELIRELAEQIDAHRKARQAMHAEVTLTGLYNVLEKLRSGEALSAKERLVHDQGLVGVLKDLHDELDTAVLGAYGWSDLALPADSEAVLERLVSLNARRVAEEAAGKVRWVRPEFQRQADAQASVPGASTEGDPTDQPTEGDVAPATNVVNTRPWPTGLTEQIKAVAEVHSTAGRPLSLEDVAAHFSGRGRWRERLPALLDTLVALGRLHQDAGGRWKDIGRIAT